MTIPEIYPRKKLKGVFFLAAKIGRDKRKSFSKPDQPKRSSLRSNEATKPENQQQNGIEPTSPSIDPNDSTISEWVISINEKLLNSVPICESSNDGSSWPIHSIYKVPKNLREIERKAYAPQIVSIGPYHRHKKRLRDMEPHKWRLLRHLLRRTEQPLEPLIAAMLRLEPKTRRCYAKCADKLGSRDLAEMMLLDGCFVLELLRASVGGFICYGYSWADPIFKSRGVLPCIQRDLLMLENQLPLFVLDQLFELTSESNEKTGSITVSTLALQFFDSLIPCCRNNNFSGDGEEEEGLHLLDVVRASLLPPPSNNVFGCGGSNKNRQPDVMIHCVTSLRQAGITCKKRESEKFMDIRFDKGVLEIPTLVIHDSTKSIFLNLMAFEQCYPHCSNHVTSYVSFMGGLINCPKDVWHLRSKGIVDNRLGGEDDVAKLFNRMCREIVFDINDCYLGRVSADVARYYERRWHRWWATLRHEYFHNPWAIVSILAAVLLIGLTLAQTFYTVFAYYVPPS